MDACSFDTLFRQITDLTSGQCARLLDHFAGLLDSRTVRKATQRVGVAKNTSMRWRRRFLAWTKNDRPAPLSGIADADETFLLESQKAARPMTGRRASVAARHPHRESLASKSVFWRRATRRHDVGFVTGRGPVTKTPLHQHLGPMLSGGSLLVTDGNRAYRPFAREAGVEHAYVNVSGGARAADQFFVRAASAPVRRMYGTSLFPLR